VDRIDVLGLPVIGINVSESLAIGEKFSRLRDGKYPSHLTMKDLMEPFPM
jgi:hypothetical protein